MRLLRRPHYKRIVLVALTLVIPLYLVHNLWVDLRTLDFDLLGYATSLTVTPDPPGTWSKHPVAVLHDRAEQQFQAFLRRQSKTADAAEAEYTRRYARPPPPGFRQWAEYALKHGSPVIDDFDTIADGVHRYHKLTPAEIERRMRRATVNADGLMHNGRVRRCTFTGGEFGKGCRHFATSLTELLGRARQLVPDVDFLINFLDEPSVLLAEQDVEHTQDPVWENLSHQPLRTAVAEACSVRGNTSLDLGDPVNTYGLPFVADVAAAKDLCQHPDYSSQHGFLVCPATMMRMKTDVPILSQAAPYPFADILYPSTHYGLESSLYRQSQDRAWSRKRNAAYWAGSSTGGYWSGDTWRNGHRQRLATLGMARQKRNFTHLSAPHDNNAEYFPYISPGINRMLFNIALTKVVGCADDAVCDEQKTFFGLPRSVDSEFEPFRYRFVIDIDGNSYSGRFYRFLASRSVPLKVSIFREWHDDRLVPWLHYIPVSQSLEELPELMRFLATTSEGQAISRRIAEAGREWYFRALTPVHQGIYLYRLMLELAWMQDLSR